MGFYKMLPMQKEAKMNICITIGTNKNIPFSIFQNNIYNDLMKAEEFLNSKDGGLRYHFNLQEKTLIEKFWGLIKK